jgi:hypothetical protein
MERRLRIAALVAGAALAVVVVLVLSQSGHHRTSSNGAPPVTQVPLPAGGELCQGNEFLPAETGRITLYPAEDGGSAGPLTVRAVSAEGDELGAGRTARRDYGPDATAAAEFAPLPEQAVGAVVCIRNEGAEPTALRGDAHPGQGGAALLVGGPDPGPPPYVRMRFEFEFPEASTWWSFAPEIAERFGLVKATFFGTWTFWVTLAALLVLALGTLAYAARALAR